MYRCLIWCVTLVYIVFVSLSVDLLRPPHNLWCQQAKKGRARCQKWTKNCYLIKSRREKEMCYGFVMSLISPFVFFNPRMNITMWQLQWQQHRLRKFFDSLHARVNAIDGPVSSLKIPRGQPRAHSSPSKARAHSDKLHHLLRGISTGAMRHFQIIISCPFWYPFFRIYSQVVYILKNY